MAPIPFVGNQHNWVFSVLAVHRHTWHGEHMGGIRGLHAVAGLTRTLMDDPRPAWMGP